MDVANAKTLTDAAQLWDKSRDHEVVLRFLRNQAVSKLDCIKAIRAICEVSLSEAKTIVMHSAVWRDTFDNTEELHDEIASALGLSQRS